MRDAACDACVWACTYIHRTANVAQRMTRSASVAARRRRTADAAAAEVAWDGGLGRGGICLWLWERRRLDFRRAFGALEEADRDGGSEEMGRG